MLQVSVISAGTILIAGPTGVGKTALSLLLAERLGGEIVGGDAFQLYRGLPLLTAQPTPDQRNRIPHHLVGTVDPAEVRDADRYRREALPLLGEIAMRGRRPIVTGGTGLYFKSLLGGMDELPGRDPILRAEFAGQELPALVERLRVRDPVGAARIDPHNRHRVERALEIVLLTGRPLPSDRTGRMATPPGVRGFLLTRERSELNARIAENVRTMFDQGVEAEVAALPEQAAGATAAKTLGYAEVRALACAQITREEAIARITLATQRYAKRQMTWFRNQHDFDPIDLSRFSSPEEAAGELLRRLDQAIGGL